jgi:hypothetical protein
MVARPAPYKEAILQIGYFDGKGILNLDCNFCRVSAKVFPSSHSSVAFSLYLLEFFNTFV